MHVSGVIKELCSTNWNATMKPWRPINSLDSSIPITLLSPIDLICFVIDSVTRNVASRNLYMIKNQGSLNLRHLAPTSHQPVALAVVSLTMQFPFVRRKMQRRKKEQKVSSLMYF